MSVRPDIFSSELDQTWYVDRGLYVVHDGNDSLIQGQAQDRGSLTPDR